jgi:hypothetical protein
VRTTVPRRELANVPAVGCWTRASKRSTGIRASATVGARRRVALVHALAASGARPRGRALARKAAGRSVGAGPTVQARILRALVHVLDRLAGAIHVAARANVAVWTRQDARQLRVEEVSARHVACGCSRGTVRGGCRRTRLRSGPPRPGRRPWRARRSDMGCNWPCPRPLSSLLARRGKRHRPRSRQGIGFGPRRRRSR